VPICSFDKDNNSPFCHAASNLPSGGAACGGTVRASVDVHVKIAGREKDEVMHHEPTIKSVLLDPGSSYFGPGWLRSGTILFFRAMVFPVCYENQKN
jgi:hypothetical protein